MKKSIRMSCLVGVLTAFVITGNIFAEAQSEPSNVNVTTDSFAANYPTDSSAVSNPIDSSAAIDTTGISAAANPTDSSATANPTNGTAAVNPADSSAASGSTDSSATINPSDGSAATNPTNSPAAVNPTDSFVAANPQGVFTALKLGDSGDQVKEVQELLCKNIYTKAEANGTFDELTEQAVKDFQELTGLAITGIVDQTTYDKLKEERFPVTYTLTANLWVRDQPSITGNQIGTLDVLQQVEVYGFENTWAKINYNNSTAYISGFYVKPGVITEGSTTTYTLLRNLWVRDSPNGNVINTGTIIGTRDAYQQVEVYGFENGWARIQFPYYPAYVYAAYLQEGVVAPPPVYIYTEPVYEDSGQIVYWVPNGEVYHLFDYCPTLARSSDIYYGTIAESRKSRVCEKCWEMAH